MKRFDLTTSVESLITNDVIEASTEIPARNAQDATRIALRDIVALATRPHSDHFFSDWRPQVISCIEVRP